MIRTPVASARDLLMILAAVALLAVTLLLAGQIAPPTATPAVGMGTQWGEMAAAAAALSS